LFITIMRFSHCRLHSFASRTLSWMVKIGHMMKVIRENIKLVSWKGNPLDIPNSFPL
jgi:hypothetical protein